VSGLRTLLRDRRAAAGFLVLACCGTLALLAPLVAPADPLAQQDVLATRYLAPLAESPAGVRHWLGTDAFGRDVLSRLLYGARISLAVGLLSVAVSLLVGMAVGVLAAALGGVAERTLMAATDAALAMPRIVLLLALITLWEPSLALVVLVLGFTGWMPLARLARAEVKGVLGRPFVDAARASGVGRGRLVWRHVLPNATTSVMVAAALGVGNAIMLEAGLSFLGLGIPAPAPSWGNMIASGREALVNAPWIATFPGLAVVVTVIATSLIADGARDMLDPRTREGGGAGAVS